MKEGRRNNVWRETGAFPWRPARDTKHWSVGKLVCMTCHCFTPNAVSFHLSSHCLSIQPYITICVAVVLQLWMNLLSSALLIGRNSQAGILGRGLAPTVICCGFRDAVHGFSREVPRVFDLKNYSVHRFLLLHQRRKVETRKGNISFHYNRNWQKMDPQPINQPYRNTLTPIVLQPLTVAFHGHSIWTVARQKFDTTSKWPNILRKSPFSFLYLRDRLTCAASVHWLIEGPSSNSVVIPKILTFSQRFHSLWLMK